MNLDQILNPWLRSSKEYAAGRTFEYVMEKYGFKREEILRLAGNETTVGISPKAIEAAKEAILGSNFYDEPRSESLVTELEKFFAKRNIDFNKVGIVAGNGMDSIIDHILMLFTDSQQSIIDLSPTFTYYKFSAKRLGAEVIEIPRKVVNRDHYLKYEIDFEGILKNIKNNTKLVFLCSPNNPDGAACSLEEIENLTKQLLNKNILLFVDHAYIDFCDRDRYDAANLVAKYPNLIVGYTFSKAYSLAGFRVGYALMSKELQKKYFNQITPFLCSRPSIAAAKAALNDQEHLKKVTNTIISQRDNLSSTYSKLGFEVFETEANFHLLRPGKDLLKKITIDFAKDSLAAKTIADYLLEKLLSKGIIVRAMLQIDDLSLRFTIGTEAENQRLIRELQTIVNA